MPSRPLSPEAVCRLAAELEAAVRAGVPIDLSLAQMARSAPGRLGQVAAQLARRIEQGESLAEALDAESEALPASFRTVLIASVHSDETADVLRDLRDMHVKIIDLRNRYRRSVFYPAMVILVAYGLLLVVMTRFVPQLAASWTSLHRPFPGWLQILDQASASVAIWGPAIPLSLLFVVFVWESVFVRASLADRFLGFHRLQRSLSLYQSLLVLQVLLERNVSLTQALRFAGEASTIPLQQVAWARVAERVGQGSRLGNALADEPTFPPDVRWLLGVGEVESCLPKTTERLATLYATAGLRRAEWFGAFLPGAILFFVATLVTFWYGLLVMLPVIELWGALGAE